ncbi:glutamate-binding protein [Actinorhabdospora filicis]|uniref:Glutamate-binding protein n=1 Tax=Actinorhabdospora filicis TaxID=1785913 RepID=A0A9W6SFA7_9ACTN|nr:glutamate ABC transporter substrate-binding protein [Actinorhabdospora filicis]GLZ75258.1 glutamate-binding protein [Actinorhabdospora filicis]
MRMHRKLALVGLAAVALLATACQGKASDDQKQAGDPANTVVFQMKQATTLPAAVQKIKERGYLLFGSKFDQPTTGERNPASGKIEGFDANFGRLLAQRIFGPNFTEGENGQLRYVETISKNREEFLASGKVDALAATYTINEPRKEKVDFAGPYYITGMGILTLADRKELNTLEDLNGKKVCVAVGSNSLTNLQKLNPKADVSQPLADYSACRQAVENKSYEALVTDEPILRGFMSKSPGVFRVADKVFTEEPYGIASKHGDKELRDFINDMLEEAYANGDWVKSFEGTLGKAGAKTPTPPPVVRY